MQKTTFIIVMLALSFIACTNAEIKGKAKNTEENGSVEGSNDSIGNGVIINGVKWATRNVDRKGVFTDNPEDIGMLYQWNGTVGWDIAVLSEDVIIDGWDKVINEKWNGGFKTPTTSDSWSNNVCPKGWRLPSTKELEQLMYSSNEWGILNGQMGRYFGSGKNKIFLPATGMLSFNGKHYLLNKFGAYWSSESATEYNTARYFSFDSNGVRRLFGSRALGHCIRCVADEAEYVQQKETAISKEKNCKNSISWGEINICLPEIDKMKNIYPIPKIKKILDEWEVHNSTIFAYYVSDEIYAQIDNIEEIIYDDYFKVSSVNNYQNAFADKNALDKVASGTKAIFNTDFQKLSKRKEIEKKNMSFDKPILIDDYHINPDVNTFSLLTRVNIGGYERIMVMMMNIAVVKNRIVYIGYYKDYEGEESIKQARAKNDYFVLRFMNEN